MRKLLHVIVHPPLVALFDLLVIHLSFCVVLCLKWVIIEAPMPEMDSYVHVVPYISVASVAILYVCNLYVSWLRRKARDVVYSVLVSVAGIALCTFLIQLWEREFRFPKSAILEAAVLQFTFLAAYRVLLQSWFLAVLGQRRVLMIAPDDEAAVQIMQKLQVSAPEWMAFTGYIVCDELESLEQRRDDFDTVLLAPRMTEERAIVKLCAKMKKRVMVIPAMLELSLFGSRAVEIDDVLILSIQRPHLTPGARLVKRFADLLVSSVVLALASPVLAAVAAAIKLTSKGPAIFKQDRVGLDGQEYTLYKFRTMIADAEKQTGPVLASEADSRITPIGRWLRATRLDELPQLFNVVKGDMSLVGPRPEREFFVNQFRDTVVGYDLRFSVKPGITGLAQVAGGYSTTVERKLRFDLMYIFDYSLLLDIQILLRTILVMINKTQAVGVTDSGTARPAVGVGARSATGVGKGPRGDELPS